MSALELGRLFSLMEGVDPEGLFTAALRMSTGAGGGALDAALGGAGLPNALAGLEGLAASQMEDGGLRSGVEPSGGDGDEGAASTDGDSRGSVGGTGTSGPGHQVPPRTGSINDRKCTKVGRRVGGWGRFRARARVGGGRLGWHSDSSSRARSCSRLTCLHAPPLLWPAGLAALGRPWRPPLTRWPRWPSPAHAPRKLPAVYASRPQVLPASSSAPKYKFVVPNEYVYKFMQVRRGGCQRRAGGAARAPGRRPGRRPRGAYWKGEPSVGVATTAHSSPSPPP